jgi:hypothetical protein
MSENELSQLLQKAYNEGWIQGIEEGAELWPEQRAMILRMRDVRKTALLAKALEAAPAQPHPPEPPHPPSP